MTDMAQAPVVTIFGGSGFVGRYIAQNMARQGWRVRVAVRRPNEALFVKTYGTVGQVEPIQANVRDEASTARAIAGADAVVNCVAVLFELGKQSFDSLHVEAAGRIARLSRAHGVSTLLHISALGADADSKSEYAQSKAAGEAAVLSEFPNAAIFRPSIIFGNEDGFFNRFAQMSRSSPFLPIFGAKTEFQPVYVADVADAAEIVLTRGAQGVFELGGPEVASFEELMKAMLKVIRRKNIVIGLPSFVGHIMGSALGLVQFLSGGLIPNSVVTKDQVRTLAYDNVVSGDFPGLEELGIQPTTLDTVLESYLYVYRPYGQYTALTESGRDLRQS